MIAIRKFHNVQARAAALLLLVLGAAGGGAAEPPRVEQMNMEPLAITFAANPPRVRYDRDTLLTITVTAPDGIDVELPDLADRAQGFRVSGFYAVDPRHAGDRVVREYRARLTPLVAAEYRLAPMAIKIVERRRSPATENWVATRPIVFEVAPAVDGTPARDIHAALPLRWIPPSFAQVCVWLAAVLAVAAGAWGLWRLARRVRREVILRRMSPRERALLELGELLGHDYLRQHLFKEFYIELTFIVRRYVERRHGVRAPEQTTEEFFAAIRGDARFTPAVVERLKTFLRAADLVKYAAAEPGIGAAEAAVATAREYVETDAAADPTSPPRKS